MTTFSLVPRTAIYQEIWIPYTKLKFILTILTLFVTRGI